MDLQELKHIERAMELIENRDEDFRNNNLWQKLKEAENIWYERKANEQFQFYMHQFELYNDIKFKEIAEENLEFYKNEKEKLWKL